MSEVKLSQKEIREWCNNHKCTKEDCEYMDAYCHIQEYEDETCSYCTTNTCKHCKKF